MNEYNLYFNIIQNVFIIVMAKPISLAAITSVLCHMIIQK